jgi:DNA-binding NarL/FixJ family response regulator
MPAVAGRPHGRRPVTDGASGTPGQRNRPFRVLVVDDCADLRNLVRLRLTTTDDFSVVGEASDGEDAIAQAAHLQPDIVVLDLSMPRMDGLEALPAILRVAPATRVVVFSGMNEGAAARQALAAGADRYVVKGTPLKELVESMAACLRPMTERSI